MGPEGSAPTGGHWTRTTARTRARFQGRKRILALAVVIGAVAVTSVHAPSLVAARSPEGTTVVNLLREELSTRQQIEQERGELKRVHAGRRAVQGELRRVNALLGEVRRRREGVERDSLRQRERLRGRLRAIYRLVRRTAHRPLLDPRRARLPGDGRRALLRIIRRDVAELRHLEREVGRLARLDEEVRRRHQQAVAVLGDLDRRRDVIRSQLAHRRQELAALRHRRRNHKGQAGEWNKEAYRLERQIVAAHLRLQRQVVSFKSRQGDLIRPVPGLILGWFGQERLRSSPRATARLHGVEISALPNWKVKAPAGGIVRFASHVEGHGNVVIVDHDEGYLSVIGYLGRLLVSVGHKVGDGQPIASLEGAPPRKRPVVYYELRCGGRAIDPVPWLNGGRAELKRRGPRRKRRRPAPEHIPVADRRPGAPAEPAQSASMSSLSSR